MPDTGRFVWIRVQPEQTPTVIANPESPEMAWLEQNAQQLGLFKGEWLLIHGRELVVHSRDFSVLRSAIRERQVRSPFVYYVPTDEESNSVNDLTCKPSRIPSRSTIGLFRI